MSAKIKQYQTVEEAQNAVAREICVRIEQSKNIPSLLFFSGGSCLTLLPYIQQYLERIPLETFHLTIGMVDERFDTKDSNYVHLKKEYGEFYTFMCSHGATFIDTSPRLKNQYTMAKWYEEEVRREISDVRRRNGKIITLLGMGPDGHIAGILPYPDGEQKEFYETFLDTRKLVVGYDATEKNQFSKRFTLTFPALLQADHIFVYISGEEKRNVLRQALSGNPPLHACPAYFFQTTEQNVEIFTPLGKLF